MFLSVLQFPCRATKIYVTGVDFLLTLLWSFPLRFEQNQVDTFDAWGDINNGVWHKTPSDLTLKISLKIFPGKVEKWYLNQIALKKLFFYYFFVKLNAYKTSILSEAQ